MKPIPKSLLIHSAAAIAESEPDMWGSKTEDSRTELEFVRIKPSSALKLDSRNEQIQLSAVLFYDCRNSKPPGFDFSHAKKILFCGEQYKIVRVDKLYDERGLHHLEVGLCL